MAVLTNECSQSFNEHYTKNYQLYNNNNDDVHELNTINVPIVLKSTIILFSTHDKHGSYVSDESPWTKPDKS